MASVQEFNTGQMTKFIAQAAASKVPLVAAWAETIGDLAERATDLAARAKEACHR
jgi:hypothetical protein